jgi:putative transposase
MTDVALISCAAVIRLYPNRAQSGALRRWQGGLRYVWNNVLDCMFKARSINGKWPTKAEVQSLIVGMKKEPGTEWLADIPAHALLKLSDDIMAAFKNWFDSISGKRKGPKMGRPQFRGKYARQFSIYMVNQNTTFGDGIVKLPKLGAVKFRAGDLPEGRLLSSRVYRDADKWFMSSVFECARPAVTIPAVDRVGIDMGVKTLATVFDGERVRAFVNVKALERHKQRLARYQRRVSRRMKGSHRREAAKRRLARLHQRIAEIRKDAAHKATTAIVSMSGTLVIESLSVKGMMMAKLQSKAIADASMGGFLRLLRYKADWQGRRIVEADKWFPSSQLCSVCKTINKDMAVKRLDVLRCGCGNIMQRDENAARNLFAYREEPVERRRKDAETAQGDWRSGTGSDALLGADRRTANFETAGRPSALLK